MKGAWREDKGESKDRVINDLHLPEKRWTGLVRDFSKRPTGKNSSAYASNAVAIYYLPVGKNITGTSVWNTSPNGYEYAYAQRGRAERDNFTRRARAQVILLSRIHCSHYVQLLSPIVGGKVV